MRRLRRTSWLMTTLVPVATIAVIAGCGGSSGSGEGGSGDGTPTPAPNPTPEPNPAPELWSAVTIDFEGQNNPNDSFWCVSGSETMPGSWTGKAVVTTQGGSTLNVGDPVNAASGAEITVAECFADAAGDTCLPEGSLPAFCSIQYTTITHHPDLDGQNVEANIVVLLVENEFDAAGTAIDNHYWTPGDLTLGTAGVAGGDVARAIIAVVLRDDNGDGSIDSAGGERYEMGQSITGNLTLEAAGTMDNDAVKISPAATIALTPPSAGMAANFSDPRFERVMQSVISRVNDVVFAE